VAADCDEALGSVVLDYALHEEHGSADWSFERLGGCRIQWAMSSTNLMVRLAATASMGPAVWAVVPDQLPDPRPGTRSWATWQPRG